MYKFRKFLGKSNFSEQFRKLINRYKRYGYSLDIMRLTAHLVVNPIIVDGFASLFNCTTAVRASDSDRANLNDFRTFDRFVFVWICRFPLPIGVWEGLRFVIVAFPGLFCYLLFYDKKV